MSEEYAADFRQPAVPHSAILLVHCTDRRGLVALVTEFIYKNNGTGCSGGSTSPMRYHIQHKTLVHDNRTVVFG